MSEIAIRPQSELEVLAMVESTGLADKAVAIAYFSFAEPDSFIAAHDPGGVITRLIEFLPLSVRGADLLAAIAAIDKNSPRLLANYLQTFPELHAALTSFCADQDAVETGSLAWLLGAGSLAVGLEQPDLERALLPSLAAVKLDTVVIDRDGDYFFDGRRFLRSLMSYRIGGVPRDVLARSMFESLGDFAVDAVGRLLKDWKADAILCAGDLFGGNNILRVHTRSGMIAMHLPMHFPPVKAS